MRVTLPGIVTLVRDLQSEKAYSPMLVTPSAITADFTLPCHGAPEEPLSYIYPLPLIVSTPSLSSVQVTSAPQVPLSTMSAASAVAGRSDAIISTASTKLKSRFFMCFLPIRFFCRHFVSSSAAAESSTQAAEVFGIAIKQSKFIITFIITFFIKYAIPFTHIWKHPGILPAADSASASYSR